MRIELPSLHPNQQYVLDTQQRFNVLSCGRRWGKTTLGMDRVVRGLLLGQRVCWASPTYKMLDEIWRELLSTLHQVLSKVNQQQHYLTIKTGGSLDMWSLDNANALRGRKYHLVIIDEAAMVADLENSWNAVLRPTLADMQGSAWFLSTPKGRNYFWDLYQRGTDIRYADWASWQMPTHTNPHIPSSEIEILETSLPELVARQELYAIPVTDGGTIFRNIDACVAEVSDVPIEGHSYVFGIDIGRTNDYTAIAVFDQTTMSLVKMDRFTAIGFSLQEKRIQALYEQYQPEIIICEINNFGFPMVERLLERELPVRSFQTSNQKKAHIIENLAMAFEQGIITIPNDPVTLNELYSYEVTTLPSGLLRYSAPKNIHDDTVMALAFAYFGAV